MPRPNVSLTVVDDSIVIPAGEPTSPTIGLFISEGAGGATQNLQIFGTTAEKGAGYYYVPTLNDWYGRLQTFTQTEYNLGGASGLTFIAANLATNGATFWTNEWYAVNNFLQYGAPCYVGFNTATVTNGFEAVTPDVVFSGGTANNDKVVSFANTKANKNEPVFAILAATTETFQTSGLTALNEGDAHGLTGLNDQATQFCAAVFGEKKHLNAGGESTSLVTTALPPDVAGCCARTDRTAFPWLSPAGIKRGKILDVVSLVDALTDTQQDALYDLDINPVVSFAGEGTFLFGDRSFSVNNASTLDAVNVSRLVIYLRKVLGQLGRTILFEQNDSISRNRFLTSADAVLRNVKAQSGISEYKIICDETNNPPSVIQARQFVADVLIKAIPSINFVKITITNKSLTSTL